jgi:RNA polymerase sigma-70 factor (ECF subfamily)
MKDPLANPEPLIKRVYAYVAYRVGDGPDAEDLTSDVFERALRYRESYDPARGEPIGWLIGIARRLLAQGVAPAAGAEPPAELAAAGDLEDDAVRRLTVARAVATLAEHDRELVALRFGADLTARQIAELLGKSTNAVEVALHRALDRLRPLLRAEPGGYDEEPAPGFGRVEPGLQHD